MTDGFSICDKKIKLPIVQGGMGIGVSKSGLATAVINCGGVGTISAAQIGFEEPDFYINSKKSLLANIRVLEREIKKVRENSEGFLAVNIVTASRQYAELAKTAVKAGADAIVSGAGLPLDMPAYTKGSTTANIPVVSSSRALNLICKRWKKRYDVKPDAIIVEGPLAGGHLALKNEDIQYKRSVKNLEQRFLEIKDYCGKNDLNVPIIVAGGITDYESAQKYLKLGADAIQVGTKFIATKECDASKEYKQKFIDSKQNDIRYVESPVGYPGRAFSNQFTNELERGNIKVDKCLKCLLPCSGIDESTQYCISDKLISAVKGDVKNGLVFTGANGYKIKEISTVKKVIKELLGDEING